MKKPYKIALWVVFGALALYGLAQIANVLFVMWVMSNIK